MQHTAYQMQLLFSQGRRVALDVRARELVEPARWLKENAEPGELVYHDTWDAFPFLFFYSPESHYLVGFDPYFFYQHDPYRVRDWTLATAARLSLADTQAHLRAMGARYVLATKLRPGFRLHMDRMREAQPVYTSDFATSKVATFSYLFYADAVAQSRTQPGYPTKWGTHNSPSGPVTRLSDYGMDTTITGSPIYGPMMLDSLESLPVVSIVMDIDDLFDQQTGIYSNPEGEGEAWERPASVEFLSPRMGRGQQADVGIRLVADLSVLAPEESPPTKDVEAPK